MITQMKIPKKNLLSIPGLAKKWSKTNKSMEIQAKIKDPSTGCSIKTTGAKTNIKEYDCLTQCKEKKENDQFDSFFTLEKKLGEGAQSVVYKCIEKKSGEEFAVKIIKKGNFEQIESIRKNYQILRQLDHEFIVKGSHLFLNEEMLTCHIVMEFSEYPDLRTYMNNSKNIISEIEAARILSSLFQCLVYLEEKGVCHRDLKPENILYNPDDGKIKIIDFQLARMQRYKHEKLELISNCGSLYYRAPETFKGEYGIPVDMWSVGVIGFELLTGKIPFKSVYYKQTVDKICKQEIDFCQYKLSPLAIKLLKKMLQKDPLKRIKPKECLSDPFVLQNPKGPIRRRSFCVKSKLTYQYENDENEDMFDGESKTYSQEMQFNFRDTFNKDIGVHRYSSNKE